MEDKDPISTALGLIYGSPILNGDDADDGAGFDAENIEDIMSVPLVLAKDNKSTSEPDYKQDVIDDYSFIRQSYIVSIEEAQRALKDARVVARVAPCSKIFDSITKLLKVIADNSEKLIKLHMGISDASKPTPPNTVVEAESVVIASTEDIINRARAKMKKDKD